MDAFEETINFLKECAELFQQASFKLRISFAEILVEWLLPIAAVSSRCSTFMHHLFSPFCFTYDRLLLQCQ